MGHLSQIQAHFAQVCLRRYPGTAHTSHGHSSTMYRLPDGCNPFRKKWKSLAPSVHNIWEEQNKSVSEAFPVCLLNALKTLGSKLSSRACISGFTEAAGVSDAQRKLVGRAEMTL